MLQAQQPEDSFARLAPFYDQLMGSIPYAEWVDYIEKVMRAYDLHPKKILDVACGTGTVALLLAQRGYEVVGVDRSEPMLEVARKKAAAAGLEIPFLCQNAAALKLKEKLARHQFGGFDLALCLYDSLNYLVEEGELLAALRGIRRALAPGGALFFDLNTLYSFQQELFTQESEPGAEVGYRWESRFEPTSLIAQVEMHFTPPEGGAFQVAHRQRAYLVEEVVSLLRKARFQTLDLFEAYTLLPPGRLSERIFYLAQKPAARKTGAE